MVTNSPILLKIQNLSDAPQEVNLFSEYGVSGHVEIKSYDNVPYGLILSYLLGNCLTIDHILIRSDRISYLEKVVAFNQKTIYGSEFNLPIKLMDYISPLQYQETLLFVPRKFELTLGTSVILQLEPKEAMVLSLFQSTPPHNLEPSKKYKLIEYTKVSNVNLSEETILQPSWESGITHIRTVGFDSGTITVGENTISSMDVYIPCFAVKDIATHTPMRIKIPKDADGYILFFKEIIEPK